MAKKHFQEIAKILHDSQRTGNKDTIENISRALADMFQRENPLFDIHKFLKACNIEK